MKKVLIIASNLKIGGAQKMIEQLVLHLDREKYIVRVIVLSKKMGTIIEQHIEHSGIDIKYLEKPLGFHFSFFKKVRNEINEIKPDIIHTHVNSWFYILPSVLFDHFFFIHTIHSYPQRQESNCILRGIIKYLYKTNRAVPVAISDKIRDDSVTVYGIPIERIERVFNPIDYASISSVKRKPHKNVVFVNVARFNAVKNQLCLIRAFAHVHSKNNNTALVFAGDGELLSQAKALSQELKCAAQVKFCGNVDDIPELLSECDIFVLPSLFEGLPISLLEAEAIGLPVIASNIGGIPDIVDRNGILVPVNDEAALSQAMLDLAENLELRESMGVRSREIARRFRADLIAKEYEALYDKYGQARHQ